MKHFEYMVVSRTGERVKGEIEAFSRKAAVEQLHKLGHLPVQVSERMPGSRLRGTGAAYWRAPTARQVTTFTRDLAMLLKSGMTLDRSLTLLEQEASSKGMAALISSLNHQIASGKSFAEALAAQGRIFPPMYSSMIQVAEASGTLESTLTRVAEGRHRAERLRSKAISALIYPALLITMAIAVILIMLMFVVPRFKRLISHSGVEMPDAAARVIGISDALIANWQALALSALVLLLLTWWMWTQPTGRRLLESLLFRMPVAGSFLQIHLAVRICRSLGTLLQSGVELPVAIRLIRDSIGSRMAHGPLDHAYDALRRGRSFLVPLNDSKLLPSVAVNMLRVGEETGAIAPTALHVAEILEERLETGVQRAFTILEPVIILVVSVIVAALLVTILDAVISINDLAM